MKKTDLQMRGQKIGMALAMVLAVLLLLFPVTVHAEGELQVTELSTQGEITSDVNVRKGPSIDYDKIGTVRVGETIPVTGETADGWYRVTYQGQEGYIYGKYMTVQQTEPPADNNPQDGDGTAPGELPEKAGGFSALKLVAIVFIIIVIIIMIFLTIRSMRQTVDEDDEDEDEEDYEDYGDDDEDGEDAGEEDTEEETAPESSVQKQSKSEPYVLREEDYQLHIDPKYFEDEPVSQPECVTGYLKKKQEEEELEKKKEEEKASSGDLQKAMDKLQELQEEIERLKKNSKE